MKDILIHLNHEKTLDSRLLVAASLAKKFNATLTGLFVKRLLSNELYSSFVHPETLDEFQADQNRFSADAQKLFEQFGKSISQTVRFIEGSGDGCHELALQSSAYDLVVVAAHAESSDSENPAELPANLVLASGRPVLIVPELPDNATIGNSVLVAWNGTREATRALHDAMPILQTAGYVNIVTFTRTGEQEGIVDISDHLNHYGITYDITHSVCADTEIPQKILNFTDKFDTDLLVMGAYGHTRLREFVLGGVSRSLLGHTNIPLLVSH